MRRFSYLWILAIAIVWHPGDRSVVAHPPVFPMLPQAVDSFGAASHDGWLYVYGGHFGPQDQHKSANLAQYFVRCRSVLADEWEELPITEPLQDLSLVSSGNYLYRIGGAGGISTGDEEGGLQSVKSFARFDPVNKTWTELAPLPSPRSAHDAIAVEGKIYVVGGWHQKEGKMPDWHDTALVYDTADGESASWQSLPIPSFRRRNLAVTMWQNCIWAIGGKDDSDAAARTVFFYDPQRGYWSEGPELPMRADGVQAFGVAAAGLNSGLYVSGADGVVYRLTDVYGRWHAVAELRVPRYCHRMIPEGETVILAIAGHSISFGPTRNIERIRVYTP